MAKKRAAKVAKEKPASAATVEELLILLEANKDRGKAAYAEVDVLLNRLIPLMKKAGKKVALPDGRVAKLRDNFAGNKNKHYKPTGVSRYEIDFTRE